jgi:hypothetical protein
MPNAARNNESLLRVQFNAALLEVDYKASLDNVKKLVFVVVMVPMVFAWLENAESDDGVVDSA